MKEIEHYIHWFNFRFGLVGVASWSLLAYLGFVSKHDGAAFAALSLISFVWAFKYMREKQC